MFKMLVVKIYQIHQTGGRITDNVELSEIKTNSAFSCRWALYHISHLIVL